MAPRTQLRGFLHEKVKPLAVGLRVIKDASVA